MFYKFLKGFISIFPFYYKYNSDIKYYPEEIYVNDWKIVGNILANTIRNKINEAKKNEQ